MFGGRSTAKNYCPVSLLSVVSKVLKKGLKDDNTLYSKCDQASDLLQQLKLASELESDL